MDVDVDAAGKPFGWFLDGFDKKTERLVYNRRLLMDTAAISRMVGEDATGDFPVIPEWRDEIEANLEGAGAVDWVTYDYFIGSARHRGSDLGGAASSGNVVESVSAAWGAQWPETPPIAFLLRSVHPDRWVRFHSLPGSKRYAETDAERAETLSRHDAVLEALAPSTSLFVISTDSSNDPAGDGEWPWTTIGASDYFDEPVQLYVSSIHYPSMQLDNVLTAAAEWKLANVIIGPDDLRWLYHPYDGGADVIAATTTERNELSARFEAWLPARPEGL